MPNLDVNIVLLDPDIGGVRFQVRRRASATGANGRTQTADDLHDAVGIVVMDEKAMERADDSEHGGVETIQVLTPFALRGVSQGFQPDVVLWNGAEYLVKKVAPYRHFGAGFVKASCESTRAVDRPVT